MKPLESDQGKAIPSKSAGVGGVLMPPSLEQLCFALCYMNCYYRGHTLLGCHVAEKIGSLKNKQTNKTTNPEHLGQWCLARASSVTGRKKPFLRTRKLTREGDGSEKDSVTQKRRKWNLHIEPKAFIHGMPMPATPPFMHLLAPILFQVSALILPQGTFCDL